MKNNGAKYLDNIEVAFQSKVFQISHKKNVKAFPVFEIQIDSKNYLIYHGFEEMGVQIKLTYGNSWLKTFNSMEEMFNKGASFSTRKFAKKIEEIYPQLTLLNFVLNGAYGSVVELGLKRIPTEKIACKIIPSVEATSKIAIVS